MTPAEQEASLRHQYQDATDELRRLQHQLRYATDADFETVQAKVTTQNRLVAELADCLD